MFDVDNCKLKQKVATDQTYPNVQGNTKSQYFYQLEMLLQVRTLAKDGETKKAK